MTNDECALCLNACAQHSSFVIRHYGVPLLPARRRAALVEPLHATALQGRRVGLFAAALRAYATIPHAKKIKAFS